MTSKSFSLQWTKGVPDEDKESVEKAIRNSTTALGQLKGILEERLAELRRLEAREADYDNPAWAYKQAHRNGEVLSLLKTLELLSFVPSRDQK
jgi:hypothetical protein